MLQKSKPLAEAFGKDVIESYIKLKNSEIKDFKSKSSFNKKKPVTKWEKDNTLDCGCLPSNEGLRRKGSASLD